MTLQFDIDTTSFEYYNKLRNTFFPKHKLKDEAHITLLYQIHLEESEIIRRLSAFDFHTFDMKCKQVKNYATGNALNFEYKDARILHNKLKSIFKNKLTKKDYFPFTPHLTIQLNVTNFKAQQTHQQLIATFDFPAISVIGISLWDKDKAKHKCIYQKAFQTKGALI